MSLKWTHFSYLYFNRLKIVGRLVTFRIGCGPYPYPYFCRKPTRSLLGVRNKATVPTQLPRIILPVYWNQFGVEWLEFGKSLMVRFSTNEEKKKEKLKNRNI